uniref:Potassium transport protein n=1 Tax=Bionectria ochroleuca TaxID=29856 RepID=A0A8H7MZC2_BIOOC
MELLKLVPINFVTIHYAYIIFMGLLSIAVMLPAGNVKAIDAYFFGASASTESGLNTVDVKDLMLYQQLYIYFIPIVTNLGFINAFTVLVRLIWFRKHLKKVAPKLLERRQLRSEYPMGIGHAKVLSQDEPDSAQEETHKGKEQSDEAYEPGTREASLAPGAAHPRIIIDDSAKPPRVETSGHAPGLQEGDQEISVIGEGGSVYDLRRRRTNASRTSLSMESVSNVAYVAKTMLILDPGSSDRRSESNPPGPRAQFQDDKLRLSRHVTIGRNSEFVGLTKKDWERIGGLEYRSLKLLVKIVFSYFFGLHLLGVIFLVGWIQYANPKYKEYLAETGQNMNWWAVYSAQTMVDNLGFTLTPDSMISFRDAIWPMIAMSFLAFAGNTLYPVFLRLLIWTISKVAPKDASIQEPLSYLLHHPRRCYTLLFPSRPTWILFSIIFCLNFVDTLLIIVLDLYNPEVASLPAGQRLFAAIFQAASSRHTGTSTFNLANVNPAVQFSLMVMMYIAIFPIALAIRSSNVYEEKSLGVWSPEGELNESNGRSYIMRHIQNQLNFDLWYIFLGIFCICIAEAERIADVGEPSFTVWSIFFEVTSA